MRAPRGYAPDHPRLRLLRCKSLTVTRRHALGPWLHRPQAGRTIREELEAAAPLVRWIGEHVGPSLARLRALGLTSYASGRHGRRRGHQPGTARR